MSGFRIEKLRLGNGLWESARFNSRLQVTEFNLGYGSESGSLWKLQQEYGEVDGSGNVDTAKNTGNIARQTVSFNGLAQPFVTSYKYDSLFRLTEARETQNSTQTWKQNFTYDRYGNRLTHQKFFGSTEFTQTNVTHPTIDVNTNRFEGSQGFEYDKNGNLVTDPTDTGRSFVFNGDNKQKEVRDANNNLIGEYFFDGEGKRVKKHIYNGGAISEVTIFVYSGGKLIAEYSTAPLPQDPTTKWTVTDQLGSPRILVDSLGQVVARRDFMPFGEEIFPDGTHRKTTDKYNFSDNVRQKFTGYQKDDETQLDFAEARMYQNLHGRFTAVDPLLASGKSANPQTFNRYIYVMNNPLRFTDPTGLQTATNPRNEPCLFSCNFSDRPYERIPLGIDTSISQYDFSQRMADRLSSNAAQQLIGGFNQGLQDIKSGSAKGVGNAFIDTWNGGTDMIVNSRGGIYVPSVFNSNPFAIERYQVYSDVEARWSIGIQGGVTFASGVAAAPFRASSTLSILPQESTILNSTNLWSRTSIGNTRVYQRSDIFDPNLTSSWLENGSTVTGTNVQRMSTGRAPIGVDGRSVELHHMLQTNRSPIAEVTTTFHRTNSRIIHINPSSIGSGINRQAFDIWRSNYWINRSRGFSSK